MQAILERAAFFLPDLTGLDFSEVDVRVGLRPFAPRGLPFIGWVPGCPGLLVAAGHEGSGLTYGPGTGDIIKRYILGKGLDEAFAQAFHL